MRRVREVIVVEGKYDKNAILQVVSATVLETGGFRIFKSDEMKALLRKLAETRGLIILTDSDGAGFLIRNHLKGVLDSSRVKHAYIPDIPGKERRKARPSGEGTLGVEGMRPDVLLEALRRAGATFEGEPADDIEIPEQAPLTTGDLYEMGLLGGENSREKRDALKRRLGLPEKLSTKALLDIINILCTRDEIYGLLK
ncbi:DUF4093 domain-containing protein [Oscillospiraceae bacterium OttesenSCG-928-G22]|nr:DUF4093 domain-containing protein [Oscillospiraceae bacterium OttesenSCG-928-G22]